jgi:hypothetical protein
VLCNNYEPKRWAGAKQRKIIYRSYKGGIKHLPLTPSLFFEKEEKERREKERREKERRERKKRERKKREGEREKEKEEE